MNTNQIKKINEHIGAEVVGVDIATLSDDGFAELYQCWLSHQVILLRGQQINDEQLQDFSRRFGPLEEAPFGRMPESERAKIKNRYVTVISNVKVDGKPIGGLGNAEATWHSDMTYVETPPPASILYGIEVPNEGGDTHFASQYAAFDALPKKLQARLDGLSIKHNAAHTSIGKLRYGYDAFDDPREAPGAIHPIVQQHSETGRDCLYLGRREFAYIPGLSLEDSEALLDEVWSFAALPGNTMRHQWQVGDVVIWDNRCVLHRRDGFDDEQRRLMKRCQVLAA